MDIGTMAIEIHSVFNPLCIYIAATMTTLRNRVRDRWILEVFQRGSDCPDCVFGVDAALAGAAPGHCGHGYHFGRALPGHAAGSGLQ